MDFWVTFTACFSKSIIITVCIFGLKTFCLDDNDTEYNNGRLFLAGNVEHPVMAIGRHTERPLAVQVQIFFVVGVLAARSRRPNLLPLLKSNNIQTKLWLFTVLAMVYSISTYSFSFSVCEEEWSMGLIPKSWSGGGASDATSSAFLSTLCLWFSCFHANAVKLSK